MKTELKLAALCIGLVVTGLLTTVGHAQEADRWDVLRQDERIRNGLTMIAVGRQYQRRCDDIEPRRLRAFGFAQGLVNHAEGLGFTRAEIEAYVEDEAEQQRYTQIARAYLQGQGADPDDTAAVCRLGRDEISSDTPIGRMLREG